MRIEARVVAGRLELAVSDEGPGFPAEFLSRAFVRFSRASAGRAGGATGLGLAIVDAIARAHGGFAEAANRGGGGGEVRLILPQEPPRRGHTDGRVQRV